MQARTLLLVGGLVAIAALAAYGLLGTQERRGSAPESAGVAANSAPRADTAAPQPATQPKQPRRGAGTVGARAGSLGAVAAPGGRTTSGASPPAATGSTDVGGSGPGVENVPPPTPGRDPRERERTDPSGGPPYPSAFASSGGAPSTPAPPPASTAPQSPRAGNGGLAPLEPGADPDGSGSKEGVPSETLPKGQVMDLSELLRNKSTDPNDVSN